MTGAGIFIGWCYALVCIGLWTRLLPLELFGPQPKQFEWAMRSIFGSGILVAAIVAWRIYWYVNKKIFPQKRVHNSAPHPA